MALQRRFVIVAKSDGTVTRNLIRPKTEMYFERTYKAGIGTAFSGEGGATNLYRLAWEVERANNNGAVIKGFEDWLGDVDAIDIDIEDVVVPTDAAASAATSPSSPSPPG